MFRLLFVLFLATIAWCLIAGLDWIFGLGLIGGVLGLIIGAIGAVIALLWGVVSVALGAVIVALGAASFLIIPCLVVLGLIFLFKPT